MTRVKSARLERLDRLRVILPAWVDPLFDGGRWSPKIIHLAGDAICFGSTKAPSNRRTWVHFNEAMSDTIAVALCGLNVDRPQRDVKSFLQSPGFAKLQKSHDTKIFLGDGNAYFSRQGTRLIDPSEIMTNAIHPSLLQLPHNLVAAIQVK